MPVMRQSEEYAREVERIGTEFWPAKVEAVVVLGRVHRLFQEAKRKFETDPDEATDLS